MKVLVLSHVSDYVGGAERSILDVIDIWRKKYGVEAEFILRKPLGSYVPELEARGYKYHALDYTYWSDSNLPRDKERLFTTSLRNTRAILAIEKIIKDTEPDFVVTNSIVAPWAAFAAYYQKVPHVWFVREYGDLDHGREFEIGRKATFQDIGTLSCMVITNSKTLSKHVTQYIDKNKVTVLYNPFDLKDLQEKASERARQVFIDDNSLKLILISGAITPTKGQQEAIIAVGKLNQSGANVELALAGQSGKSAFMEELSGLLNKYDIRKKVHFIGYQKNPLAYAAQADIGLMASKREAFGRVTFEYIAIGKPVVGADSGATGEIIDDGINGRLYQQGNVDDMVKQIRYYAEDKRGLEKHSKNAKAKASKMMASEWTAENAYKKISESLMKFDPNKSNAFLNYTHRWLEYPEIAKDYMSSISSMSLNKYVKTRFKTAARPYYQKLRCVYARITGK